MPSREEWKAVREEFERGYITQGRTLADVSEHFAEKGFHATVNEYKKQIARWKLRKNSKRPEERRQRNRQNSRDSVDTQALEASPFYDSPSTPTMILSESPQEFHVSTDDNEEDSMTMVTQSPTINLASITLPDNLRDFDIAVWHAQGHFSLCEMLYDLQHPNDTGPQTQLGQSHLLPVHKFISRAMSLKLGVLYGDVPESIIQIMMDDCKTMLSSILREHDPRVLVFLLRLLSEYFQEGLVDYTKDFLRVIYQQITSTDTVPDPVVNLVSVLLRSPYLMPHIAETVLKSRFDVLKAKLGFEDPQTFSVAFNLANVYASNHKWLQYYNLVMAIYDSFTKRPTQSMFQSRRIGLIAFETEMIRAECEVGNFNNAINRAKDALIYCQRHQSDKHARVVSQCSVLVALADAQAKSSMPESKLSYEKALQVAKGVLPPDNYWHLRAAIGLRKIHRSELPSGRVTEVF